MSYRDDAKAPPRGMGGVLVTQKGYLGRVYFPSWHKTDFTPTIFRPLGPTDSAQKSFLPWRFNTEPLNFGDWLAARRLFRGGTASRVTFVADRYDENGVHLDPEMHPNPAYILVDAWRRGKDQHSGWERLDKPVYNKQKGIEDVRTYAMMQGILLAHRGKYLFDRPVFPALLCIPWSAKAAMEEQLEVENDKCQDPSDPMTRYACGDLLNADGAGKLFMFYNMVTKPGTTSEASAALSIDYRSGGSAGDAKSGAKRELAHYACEILEEKQSLPRTPDGRIWFAAEGKGWQPWDQVFRVLSIEEMVNMLITAYEDVPDLLLYAFEERGWLPPAFYDRVGKRTSAPARRTVAVPPGVPPAMHPGGGSSLPATQQQAAPKIDYLKGGGSAQTDESAEDDADAPIDKPRDFGPGAGAPAVFAGAPTETSDQVRNALDVLKRRGASKAGGATGQ